MNELLIPEVIFAFLSENSSTEISKPPDGTAGIHLPAQHGSKSTQVCLPVCNGKPSQWLLPSTVFYIITQ